MLIIQLAGLSQNEIILCECMGGLGSVTYGNNTILFPASRKMGNAWNDFIDFSLLLTMTNNININLP